MAATNFTPIILYHSVTASAAPTAGNLNNGELAINITDGKLFYKDNGGVVQIIATKGTGVIGGSNNQVQYNSSGALAGSANFTFDGTTATINTLNLTTVLDETYGGTGLTSYTTGDVIYASGSNTLAKLAIGANTYILTSTGSVPQWSAPSAVSVSTATNLAGGTAGAVPYQSGAGATTFLSIGTSNQVLTSTGSAPQWVSGLSLTTLSTSGNTTLGDAAADNLTINATVTSNLIFTDNTYDIGANGATRPRTIYAGTSIFSPLVDTTNLEVTNIKALDGTAAASIANSTGVISISANPVLSGGTANGVVYLDASKVATSGSGLTYDGTTLVSANGSVQVPSTATFKFGSGFTNYIQGDTSSNYLLFATNSTEKLRITSGGQVNIGGNFTSTNNTLQVTGNAAIGYTTAAPTTGLIVAGNVGIGTDSPTTAYGYTKVIDIAGSFPGIKFTPSGASTFGFQIGAGTSGFQFYDVAASAERARITSGGYFKASNNGTYYGSTGSQHELRNTANGEWVVRAVSASATDPNGMEIRYSAATPNGTANRFLYCLDSTALRAEIRSNGGLANYQSNNVDLSDVRTKTDISPLASYWSKIAALEIVSYKYKDQTHDDLNIGVIAQQVEQVAPEFVDADGFGETPEDGVPLKTIYNKDLTFAAIKALQEAMARIEKLEAEVAALKGV